MTLPYKAAAITTLNTLEVESNQTKHGVNFEVGKFPSAIAIDEGDDTVYVANSKSDTVSVIDGDTLNVKHVQVDDWPISIAVDQFDHTVFVANFESDTVSVIDGYTRDIKQIPVGDEPISIAVNELNGTLYVANYNSSTISVIDTTDFTNIANVTVECCPRAIAVDEGNSAVYVGINSPPMVSVINATDFTNIANVTVECCPGEIAVDEVNSTVYVANYESNDVSVIDGDTRDVTIVHVGCCIDGITINEIYDQLLVAHGNSTSAYVSTIFNGTLEVSEISANLDLIPLEIAVDQDDNIVYVSDYFEPKVFVMDSISLEPQSKVSFSAEPFHAGHIECIGEAIPTNQYLYFDSKTPCKAQPNKGFEFLSWEENFGGNSTRIIKISQPASSLDSILDFFGISKPEEPEATLSTTNSGTFTANFKELPTPIPPEYLVTLFAVVVGAFIGSWLTPTFIGWRRTKKQGNKLDYYQKKIIYLYKDSKLDKNDIDDLDKLRDSITDEYARDKISKEQFDKLVNDISIRYQEIFRKEIDSVMIASSEKDKEKELNEIKYDIEVACAKGKISELHYTLLNKRAESFVNTNKNQIHDDMKRRSPL